MANERQPIELIMAKGKKHLTMAEIAERKAQEVKAPTAKRIKVPDFVPEGCRREYRALARQLIDLDIFSELDSALLGRYVVAQAQYETATALLIEFLKDGDSERVAEWTQFQRTYFNEATECAKQLGLTITSRCRLVVPKADKPDADELDYLFG